MLSAFAGVYSELLLKKDGNSHSIHLQNMMLYSWGVLFNAMYVFFINGQEIAANGGLLQGYTPMVWLLIVNNALIGLAISAILKFANNLVRVFAHTAAMMVTMILETILGTSPFSPQVLVSVVIVGSSTFLYNRQPAPKVQTKVPSKPKDKRGVATKEEGLSIAQEGAELSSPKTADEPGGTSLQSPAAAAPTRSPTGHADVA